MGWLKKGGWIPLLCLIVVCASSFSLATRQVEIKVDGQIIRANTFRDNVEEVVLKNGIELGLKDVVMPGRKTYPGYNQEIEVFRAFPVEIWVDNQKTKVITAPTTVEDIIRLAGINIRSLDLVEPALDCQITKTTNIKILRIDQKEIYEDIPISPPVERINDYTLEKGIKRTVQQGSSGIMRNKIKVTYADGQEIKREVMSSIEIKPPIKKVVAQGVLTSVSRGGKTIKFKRAMIVKATAYSYSAGLITSTGQKARVGGIAVDPKVIPYGTRVYVEGYGYARAIDCGKTIKGDRIDVFLETDRECRKWGVKKVKLYILD